MTTAEAKIALDELAQDLENDNYHSVAGSIWDNVIPALDSMPKPTRLVVVTELSVETYEVES